MKDIAHLVRGCCLGCDRSVEGEDYLPIGSQYFPICPPCQDQLAKEPMAVRAALREVLHCHR